MVTEIPTAAKSISYSTSSGWPPDRNGYIIQRDKGEHNETGRERTPQQRLDFGGDVEAGRPTSGNTTKRRTRTGTLPPPWKTDKIVAEEGQDGTSREGGNQRGRFSRGRRVKRRMGSNTRMVPNGGGETTNAMPRNDEQANNRTGEAI